MLYSFIRFQVKAKIKVLANISINFSTKVNDSDFWIYQKLEQDLMRHCITKNQPSNSEQFLGLNAQILYFPLCRQTVTVELVFEFDVVVCFDIHSARRNVFLGWTSL